MAKSGGAEIVVFILIQIVQVVFPILMGGISCLSGVLLYGPWMEFFLCYLSEEHSIYQTGLRLNEIYQMEEIGKECNGYMLLEFEILDFIQNHLRTPIGDKVMPLITMLGNGGALWIVLGVILFIPKKQRKTAVILFSALIIEFLICNVCLKNAVATARPCDLNTTVKLLIPKPQDYSFPSGHTGASFAAVTALYVGKVKKWYLFLIPAILIAFSRLYLYVHFPVDILGGFLVGVCSAFLARVMVSLFTNWYGKRKGSAL